MASLKRVWTAEIEGDFIDEVKCVAFLWDVRCSNFSKKSLKKCAYKQIQKNLKDKWPENASLFIPGKCLIFIIYYFYLCNNKKNILFC